MEDKKFLDDKRPLFHAQVALSRAFVEIQKAIEDIKGYTGFEAELMLGSLVRDANSIKGAMARLEVTKHLYNR
jgi:hypothetical protein